MAHRVSVRALAEFAYEGGDLRPVLNGIERMREGMQAHVTRQGGYPEGFLREVPISMPCEAGGVELTLFGRMDGLDERANPPLVEEIKTTRMTPSDIGADDYPVHWAQADLYAYMLCKTRALPFVAVRLVYVNLTGDRAQYTRTRSAEYLETEFQRLAAPYADWLRLLDEKDARVLPSLRALKFPYDGYRAGQRDMSANCYYAFKGRTALLCQAPTGIGKTAAALFPALKALGEGLTGKIFYLTARNTAGQAAEDALERMRKRGLTVHSVRLTAKEKMCVNPGARCDPAFCPRAVGYFDRRRDALRKAMSIERLTREAIEELADEFELCPFELSLDLSETCDVVICDYNYAFDPHVKLRRYFLERTDAVLLVDEAHNLIDRARGMLSARLCQKDLQRLRKDMAALGGSIQKGAAYKALTHLIKTIRALGKDLERPSCDLEPPIPVSDAALEFTEAAKEFITDSYCPESLLTRYFEALDFVRAADEFTDEHRTLIEKTDEDGVRVTLWCFDPSKYLRQCVKKTRGCVLFSATLSPMEYYARMLGVDTNEGDALLDLPSPFPPDNLCVVRMPVSTRYHAREASRDQVADAILAMCRAKRGNYLACFPSHAYLALVEARLRETAGDIRVIAQKPRMDDAARAAFLEEFSAARPNGLLALVAMGGVFAEGIDLPGALLSGAAIVGVGIPQPTFEREALRELTDDGCGCGYHYAYTYPGMERVLQAAGRVIRTEEDTGVVLLLDDRFMAEGYEELMPPHWRVYTAKSTLSLTRTLISFWAHA